MDNYNSILNAICDVIIKYSAGILKISPWPCTQKLDSMLKSLTILYITLTHIQSNLIQSLSHWLLVFFDNKNLFQIVRSFKYMYVPARAKVRIDVRRTDRWLMGSVKRNALIKLYFNNNRMIRFMVYPALITVLIHNVTLISSNSQCKMEERQWWSQLHSFVLLF